METPFIASRASCPVLAFWLILASLWFVFWLWVGHQGLNVLAFAAPVPALVLARGMLPGLGLVAWALVLAQWAGATDIPMLASSLLALVGGAGIARLWGHL